MSRVAVGALAFFCLAVLVAWSSPVLAENKKHPKEEKGLKSEKGETETEIKFVNKSGKTVKLFWLDYEGKRKFYQTLEDGESYTQMTYLTHPWVVADENGDAWEIYLPDEKAKTIEIVAPKKL